MSERRDDIRTPRQRRSRERVEQILDAAKRIILAKGCAGLSMSGVAQDAGVTTGSIYQYFPNKSAIVHALGAEYLDLFHARLAEHLAEPPKDLEALSSSLLALMDSYYRFYRDDPVVRDIWMGAAADKELHDLDAEDTARNLALLAGLAEPLFPKKARAELRRTLRLMMEFGVAATRIAIDHGPVEGDAIIETTKRMALASWRDFVARHSAGGAATPA